MDSILGLLKRISSRVAVSTLRRFEFLGFRVTPAVYDSPIPASKELTPELFQSQTNSIGLDWNVEVQRIYLDQVFSKYATETEFEPNPNFSVVDGAILHSMIRHHRPKKIVEIGSGWSTIIAARSCDFNSETGGTCEHVAYDPYIKKPLLDRIPRTVNVVAEEVQRVDVDRIVDCDLLFIDSSHVVKIGGDVNHEILELVPRLKPGALVHWHDILLPDEYWEDWVKDKGYYWTEQYLLHAFLKFNREFDIVWASHYMHRNHAEWVQQVFPNFQPDNHRITSFWVRKN